MEILKALSRERFGSRKARRFRADGMVPGIVYGHGGNNVGFAVSGHDLALVLKHGDRVVTMELDNSTDTYLIKAVQRDSFDKEVIHVDFTRVNLDEIVNVSVQLILRGIPTGVAEGGVLAPGLTNVTVECKVTDIPDEIRVRINDLKVGSTLRVKDLTVPEGVTITTDAEAIVASCQLVADEEAKPEEVEGEETGGEPEVIGKGKEEESEESTEQ
ncbi:MAG: 50S ribosomal protein L25 [Planctomycetes bacterium]|nr:50S ribosomal protein L25 [Planctomycetota bacterium]